MLDANASRGAHNAITTPQRFRVKIRTEDFNGAVSLIEESVTPGSGPPLHVHYGVSEFFYVLDGEFLFEIGKVQCKLAQGQCVVGPPDVPHRWVNRGASDARLLFQFLPGARMEGFFEELNAGIGGHGLAASDARFLRFGMRTLGPALAPDGSDRT